MNLCSILDLQKVNIKTCLYIKACKDNPMKSSPQRLWICVDMRWSEEQSDEDIPFYSCYWSPGQNIPPKHCQTLHLSNILTGIYLVESGRLTFKSLFQSLQNMKLLYHRPVLLNLVEQSLLTSSTDFCWTKLLYHALHFKNTITKYVKYQLSTMWNTK